MKKCIKKFIYEIESFSAQGKVRQQNEDSYLVRQKESPIGPVLLAAVADGMGGLENGKQASEMLIKVLEDWWDCELPAVLSNTHDIAFDITSLESSLEHYIEVAHQYILQHKNKMGTTLSLLLLVGHQYLIKHAGDSRIYFVRTFGLEQMTNDHTWYEQERARGSLQSCTTSPNKMKSVLVNAIGVKEKYTLELARGDIDSVKCIFLCSDGVYKYLSFTEIEKILNSRKSLEKKRNAIECILENSAAKDNYTAILIQKKKDRCRFAGNWRIF